jgi:hypothetical protein
LFVPLNEFLAANPRLLAKWVETLGCRTLDLHLASIGHAHQPPLPREVGEDRQRGQEVRRPLFLLYGAAHRFQTTVYFGVIGALLD